MNLDVDIVPIRDSIAGDKLLDPIEAGELCQDQCCAYKLFGILMNSGRVMIHCCYK